MSKVEIFACFETTFASSILVIRAQYRFEFKKPNLCLNFSHRCLFWLYQRIRNAIKSSYMMLRKLFNPICLIETNRFQIRHISTTSTLFAEPPRKKRRLDPAILKIRVERKIRKAEREIMQIESQPRQPIPILEYQPNSSTIRSLLSRPSRLHEEHKVTKSEIKGAEKLWSIYRLEQSKMERRSINQVEAAQNYALETLKQIDENLYNKTVALDELSLIPYTSSHIRRETGPNPDYKPPDGSIRNTSKEWIM